MQKYTYNPHFYPFISPDAADGEQFYLASEVDALLAQRTADTAVMLVDKTARITELERDNARWINARDVWAASDRAKDARIAELEKALQDIIVSYNQYDDDSVSVIARKALGL